MSLVFRRKIVERFAEEFLAADARRGILSCLNLFLAWISFLLGSFIWNRIQHADPATILFGIA